MQRAAQKDDVLTLEEAAEILGIAPRTLRRWINDRGVPYVKIGGVLRVMRSSLMAWIKQQERTAASGEEQG